MFILAKDVTDPTQSAKPLLTFKSFQSNPDGSTSLLMAGGTFAYQQPGQYGVFGFSPTAIGAYQACKVSGQLVAFWTRPQDPAYVYTFAELPN